MKADDLATAVTRLQDYLYFTPMTLCSAAKHFKCSKAVIHYRPILICQVYRYTAVVILAEAAAKLLPVFRDLAVAAETQI